MLARRPTHSPAPRGGRPAARRARRLIAAVILAAAASSVAGLALASGTAPLLRAAANEALHQTIVVDSHGRTVYVLSPETTHHLLCRSHMCLALWPAVTVRSRAVKLQAGSGVHGRLGLVRRSNGTLQVTLRGMPLYRYSGDSARGEANGDGIKSFGGTWHALRASTSHGTAPAMPNTTTSTTPAPAAPHYAY